MCAEPVLASLRGFRQELGCILLLVGVFGLLQVRELDVASALLAVGLVQGSANVR